MIKYRFSFLFIHLALSWAWCQTGQPIVDFFPPTITPDRIITTWQGDPATSFAVTWRTAVSIAKGQGQLALAVAGPDFENVKVVEAKTELLVTDLNAAHCHSVNFTGLQPNTLYAYRVGDGNQWSEWAHFRTAQQGNAPFSFLYFGDAQNDLKSKWSRTIRQAYSDFPKANFMLHAGDLINVPQRDLEWGEWFYAGGWIYQAMPSIMTPGNHEYLRTPTGPMLSKHWRSSFALPENGPAGLEETTFFIDYQGTRFISLNSTVFLSNKADSAKQVVWLEQVLTTNPQRWTVVTMHHPVFSPAGDRDNPSLRNALKPIFERYQVDLVLQGHDHTYARGGNNLPMGATVVDPTGPVYAVSVSGPKMYLSNFTEWMDRAAVETQLYQWIHISNDSLDYRAFTTTGELYDHFKIAKKADGKKVFLDLTTPAMVERIDLQAKTFQQLKAQEQNAWMERLGAYKARRAAHEAAVQAAAAKAKAAKKPKKK